MQTEDNDTVYRFATVNPFSLKVKWEVQEGLNICRDTTVSHRVV